MTTATRSVPPDAPEKLRNTLRVVCNHVFRAAGIPRESRKSPDILAHRVLSNRSSKCDVLDVLFYAATREGSGVDLRRDIFMVLYFLPLLVPHIPDFPPTVHEAMKARGVPVRKMTLEFAETAWALASAPVRDPVDRLSAHADHMIAAFAREPRVVYAGVLNHLHKFLRTPNYAPSYLVSRAEFKDRLARSDRARLERYADACCEGSRTVRVDTDGGDDVTVVRMDLSTAEHAPRSVAGVLSGVAAGAAGPFSSSDTCLRTLVGIFKYLLSDDHDPGDLGADTATMASRYRSIP